MWGGIPHIIGWSVGPWIISKRVREVIEELEPNIHEFIPVDLISEPRNVFIDLYFLVLPPPVLDAVVADKTEFDGPMLRLGGRCVLKRVGIQGRHLWRGPKSLMSTFFCSDELMRRLKLEGLDGWAIRNRCAVVE